jgi:LEA14-like dessication related protein
VEFFFKKEEKKGKGLKREDFARKYSLKNLSCMGQDAYLEERSKRGACCRFRAFRSYFHNKSRQNMKSIRAIWAFIALLALLGACDKEKMKPKVTDIENIQVVSLSKSLAVVRADLVGENPNPVGVELSALEADVFMDGVKVATVAQTAGTTVPPGRFVVPVQVDAPLAEVFKGGNLGTAINILVNKTVQLRYQGHITVQLAGLPVKVPFEKERPLPLKKGAVASPQ